MPFKSGTRLAAWPDPFQSLFNVATQKNLYFLYFISYFELKRLRINKIKNTNSKIDFDF